MAAQQWVCTVVSNMAIFEYGSVQMFEYGHIRIWVCTDVSNMAIFEYVFREWRASHSVDYEGSVPPGILGQRVQSCRGQDHEVNCVTAN